MPKLIENIKVQRYIIFGDIIGLNSNYCGIN